MQGDVVVGVAVAGATLTRLGVPSPTGVAGELAIPLYERSRAFPSANRALKDATTLPLCVCRS